MRVLHLVPSLEPATGGPSRSVPALCRALHTAGVDVELYAFRRKGTTVTVSAQDAAFPIRWLTPLPGSRQLPTVSYYRQLLRNIPSFDLVHLHSLWNPTISVAAAACRRVGVPYMISPRGMLQEGALRRRRTLKTVYYRLWEHRTLESARAFHFLTEAEAADSRSLLNGHTPYFVVPSGTDLGLAKGIQPGAFRARYPFLQGKRILLFLGRLHWSKGLELQAQALARLIKDFPHLVWVLVGPDGGEYHRLFRRICTMGLRDYVFWTGLLPRAACLEALVAADVLLLTSRHEAHSMAMNEALAVGVPLVITDTVQFDEVGASGAGYVVRWDADHLAVAIAEILNHPKQAHQMRVAGRRLAAERLAWPKVAEAMVQEYRGNIICEPC